MLKVKVNIIRIHKIDFNLRGSLMPSIKNLPKNTLFSRFSQNDVNEMVRVAVEEI